MAKELQFAPKTHNVNTCEDYGCEWSSDLEVEHTHKGVQPFLRRVMDMTACLVDGATKPWPFEGYNKIVEAKSKITRRFVVL